MGNVRILEVKQSIFESNDKQAALLREELKKDGVFLLNLMSSPGSGKTTTLTRTIEALKDDLKIGVMEAVPAVKIMYADEIAKADNAAALINEKAAQYNEMQASALAAAKRGYVDDIIEASETRQRVAAAFEMLFTKREDRPSKKHGTI